MSYRVKFKTQNLICRLNLISFKIQKITWTYFVKNDFNKLQGLVIHKLFSAELFLGIEQGLKLF